MKTVLRLAAVSHLWIGACAAGSYLYTSTLINGINFSGYTALFIWSSTTFLYSVLQELKRGLTGLLVFKLIICAVIILITLPLSFGPHAALWLISSALISILYGAQFKQLRWGLRAVPYIKIYLIALVWVMVTSVIPIIEANLLWTSSLWIFLGSQMLLLLAVTIPFDVRDLIYDDPNMKTLPQLFGFKSSMWISITFTVMSSGLALYFCSLEHDITWYLPVILFTTLTLVSLIRVKPNSPKLYFTVVIDGLLLIQGALVWIFAETLA